jgi:pimeloyl-ACP methyl ester carboxylesterase
MYAMLWTRPDIAFAVSAVNRYAARPTQQHRSAVQRHLQISPKTDKLRTHLQRGIGRVVLFIHGISVELYPYTNFLRDLNKAGESGGDDAEVGIIALEIMPVSSRITHPALEKDVMVREVQAIVKHHVWSRFILVSHSYGSIISTHLLKSPVNAPLVGPIVFVDPVSFLLHLPDAAYNFTARRPVRANEHQLWYFGSKDIGVAHYLARRFFWSQNIVWKEDLGVVEENGEEGRDVTVVLSGRDLIVDTEAVRQYLTDSLSEEPIANGKAVCMTNGNGKTRITKIGKVKTLEHGQVEGGRDLGLRYSGLNIWIMHKSLIARRPGGLLLKQSDCTRPKGGIVLALASSWLLIKRVYMVHIYSGAY